MRYDSWALMRATPGRVAGGLRDEEGRPSRLLAAFDSPGQYFDKLAQEAG
jgi:hypothetical protein